MKNFYENTVPYLAAAETELLARQIDPSQRAVESRFKKGIRHYKAPLKAISKLARMIGAPSK